MLKKFLDSRGIKYTTFAKMIGIDPKTLYKIMYHKSDVRLSVAAKIERATKGNIRCIDLTEDEPLLVSGSYPKKTCEILAKSA